MAKKTNSVEKLEAKIAAIDTKLESEQQKAKEIEANIKALEAEKEELVMQLNTERSKPVLALAEQYGMSTKDILEAMRRMQSEREEQDDASDEIEDDSIDDSV